MISRSTSALKPVADGVPVPASARGVKDSSLNVLTCGDNAAAKWSTNCPSLNPRVPADLFWAAKSILANPAMCSDGYSGAAAGAGLCCVTPCGLWSTDAEAGCEPEATCATAGRAQSHALRTRADPRADRGSLAIAE